MSFFRHRRLSQQQPLQDPGTPRPSSDLSRTPSTNGPESKRAELSIRKRLTSLSLGIKRSRSATHTHCSAPPVGYTVAFPSMYARDSESPSPTASLDIRMPTGLGRRASVIEAEEQVQELQVEIQKQQQQQQRGRGARLQKERRNTASVAGSLRTPDLPQSSQSGGGMLRWVDALTEDSSTDDGPPIMRIPVDLLNVMFSHVSRPDVASLALVSRAFLLPALRALYSHLDLWHTAPDHVEQCIALLASKRSLGGYVHHLSCRRLPAAKDASMSTVTFAIAFTNMYQLSSLTIPRFEAHLLFHVSFRLRRLKILAESMSPSEIRDFTSWLGNQPAITSLSFPNLRLHSLVNLRAEDFSRPPGHATPKAATLAFPSHSFPDHLLSRLTYFNGPAALASALIPGRPVASAVLPVQTTLYEGLRPSAVMSALARSTVPIKQLTIKATSSKVDARTLERVFMSTGAELGDNLQVLEVEWVLEDEMLYKLILSVLPRFRWLHTLRLHRASPPPPPSSPPPTFPLPPTSLSPTRLYPSPLPSPISPPLGSRPTSMNSMSLDIPLPRAHERAHLSAWSRHCPSLRCVVFLSLAEWKVSLRNLADPLSMFVFVGFVPE